MLGKRGLSFKIGLGFGIIVLLTAVVGALGWLGVEKLNRQLQAYSVWVEIDTVMHSTITANIAGLKYDIATYTDSPSRDRFDELILAQEQIQKNIKGWQNRFKSETQIQEKAAQALKRLEELKESTHRFQGMFDNLELSNTFETAVAMQESNKQLVKVFADIMNNIINPAKNRELAEASLVHQKVLQLMLVLVASSILLAVICVLLITSSTVRPINKSISGLEQAVEQVVTGATEVASSSQVLSSGASEQAAAIEETSSSLEEMASMTRQNATNAGAAKVKMTEAIQIVQKVNQHMGDMAGAIQDITQSSEETGKIIKTIDEIAFQTNLLALNAAVEAARAGEAGAGFAVVASEVRNLAMKAAEAAKTTTKLIEKTIKAVQKGNELTRSTREAFRENIVISEKVGELVEEIAAASSEQAQGIEEVNRAVAEMDKVVQQVAATAEESAAASEEMNSQALEMEGFVGGLTSIISGNGNSLQRGNAGQSKSNHTDENRTAMLATAPNQKYSSRPRRKAEQVQQKNSLK